MFKAVNVGAVLLALMLSGCLGGSTMENGVSGQSPEMNPEQSFIATFIRASEGDEDEDVETSSAGPVAGQGMEVREEANNPERYARVMVCLDNIRLVDESGNEIATGITAKLIDASILHEGRLFESEVPNGAYVEIRATIQDACRQDYAMQVEALGGTVDVAGAYEVSFPKRHESLSPTNPNVRATLLPLQRAVIEAVTEESDIQTAIDGANTFFIAHELY